MGVRIMLRITARNLLKNARQLNDEKIRITKQLKTETKNQTIRKLKIRLVNINYLVDLSKQDVIIAGEIIAGIK